MNCPRCSSNKIIKNGRSRGKQRYRCKDCNRHFQAVTSSSNLVAETRQQFLSKPNNRQIPERVIILLTSHRSGSTWLSDAIRCHPAIEYYPTSVIYQELGLYGRRYPRDLSNQPNCTYEIEVQPGKRDCIPQFDVVSDLEPKLSKLKFPAYAVEKCHPSFFNFKPKLFLQKIAHLESLGIKVKLVCLVREPKSLMTSFMNYQERQPSWYRDIKGEKLIDFITNTYQCIQQVVKERSLLLFDYAELKTNLPQVLDKIYRELWLDLSKTKLRYLRTVSQLAPKYTDRQQRLWQTNSPFLGNKEGKIAGSNRKYYRFFCTYEKMLQQCYLDYQNIG